MTRDRFTDEALDQLMSAYLDERALGPAADPVLVAALSRTSRTRQRPAWLLPERWTPMQLTTRLQPIPRLVPLLLLIALLLAAAALAIAFAGSQRRLPAPFGLAAPGVVAFIADGHVWTSNPDGSDRAQLTTDPRIDGFPTFSRDGTRIAFKRNPVPNSMPNWEEWGDVMVADADGGRPIVLDAMVHSPSPMTWSADGRFLVYSRTVGDVDQVFVAATDGSGRRQVTVGSEFSWSPTLSPDGRTIAYAKGYPSVTGIYVIQTDGTGERPITTGRMDAFDSAEWSPDGSTLLFSFTAIGGAGGDVWSVALDAMPERRLISAPGNDYFPTWSPDGRSIAYLSAAAGGEQARVMVAAADGSNAHPVTDRGDWYNPQWSPDASHVLAVDRRVPGDGQPVVVVLDPFGREPSSTFALPDVDGIGRSDFPSWQRRAP